MTDEETQVKAVELRLDGMPEGVLNFYLQRPGLFDGAYRLWFEDDGWKQTIIEMWNDNPENFK